MATGDPFKTYEAARKSMYAAMEKESAEPSEALQLFAAATTTFGAFLQIASKNRGMYRELVILDIIILHFKEFQKS